VAVTAFCSPDSAVPPQSDRIGKTEVFLASANVVEYQTQTFNLQSSERLSAVKVVIETSETEETVGTAQVQTADSDVGSGASELSAIDLQSHRFVHSATDRPILHQQTVQLQQSVDCPPSLAFQASAALIAAAEAIPDFSASAESGNERRMAVGMIVGIVIGVAAAIAAIAFAIAFLCSPPGGSQLRTA
jgi:hypothetical protein